MTSFCEPNSDAESPAAPDAEAPPLSVMALLRQAPWTLSLAIATAALSAACSLLPPWLLYRMVAELLTPQPDPGVILHWALWSIPTLLARWVLMASSHALAHAGAFAVQRQLRLALAQRLSQVPMAFFARQGSGTLRKTLVDDVQGLEGLLAHLLPDAVAAATVPVLAAALLFALDWRLALAVTAPLPLALLAQWALTRRSARSAQHWQQLQQRIANGMGEYVRGIQVAKVFGLSARTFAELAASVHAAVQWVADFARGASAGWILFTGLLSSSLFVVALTGAWRWHQGELPAALWVLFLLLAPAVLQPLLRLTFAFSEHAQRREALIRLNRLLDARPMALPLADAPPEGPLDIEYRDVRFSYGERMALQGVSFRARAGQLTALVGPSGSGKSTLARLLPRLDELDSGQILLGGLDVRAWPPDALHAQIGMVFQDVHLFHGSVRDNLLLARPDATQSQLEQACHTARAHDFIQALPQGYDTPLGERGTRLSGGERQRLSVARALLKDAPVLVLDEATSYADARTQQQVQQALSQACASRTVLLIAHRLRTVMHADHIVVMDEGRVVGQGTHAQLLECCALYQRLWQDHEQARSWSLGRRAPTSEHSHAA